MPQINLSTYEQSESIKNDLKEMLETIIKNSGTDFSKYEPFSFQDPVNIVAGDTDYKVVLELEGKGYLSTAAARGDNGEGNAIRITIDGKVILETSSVNQTFFTGFTSRENVQLNSNNVLSLFFSGTNYIVANNAGKFIPSFQEHSAFLSNQFLFFEESLLVEIRRIGTTIGGPIANLISGGKLK